MNTGLIELPKEEKPLPTADLSGPNSRTRKWHYYWDLITTLIMRDVQLRYRRSALGIIWSMINPLLVLLILSFVFQRVVPLNVANYPAYVFCGLIAWNWFSSSVLGANNIILGNADLVRMPHFATETLALINVGSNMVNYLLTLPILFGLMLIDNIGLNWSLLWLPLLLLLQFILTTGVVMLVSALNVYFRDVEHFTTVGIMLWFYLTPIFYQIEGMPAEYRWAFDFNPMAQLIRNYRQITLGGSAPDYGGLAWTAFLAILIGTIGFFFFRSVKHSFVEEL